MGDEHISGYNPINADCLRNSSSIVAWEMALQPIWFETLKSAARSSLGRVEVYEGMVVGETQRGLDVPVNICKKKHLTNMRSSNKDIEIRLTPPREMSIDEAIEYLAEDELLEVTPRNFRIRKKILDTEERGKQEKRGKEMLEEAR